MLSAGVVELKMKLLDKDSDWGVIMGGAARAMAEK